MSSLSLTRVGWLSDYWLISLKRTWRGSVVTALVNPFLYIVALGVLLGGFVKVAPHALEGAPTYLAFVAPGMVAAQAMTLAIGEATYPVFSMIKWNKTYFGQIATPLTPADVMVAHLIGIVVRVSLACAVFLVVMACFGVFSSVLGVVGAFGVQMLLSLTFAAPICALSATMRSESGFALIFRLGMIPMFLFSGAFFPVSNLSGWMQALAKATPLWHGVDLTRMLTLGHVDSGRAMVHLAYLVILATLGTWLAVRQLTRRLVT